MKVVCFYNVNLDAVHFLEGDSLSEIVRSQSVFPSLKMPERIENVKDFLCGLLTCMEKGTGAELIIENKTVAEFIEQNFSWSYRMGGNAGNMANVLAELGCKPVVNVPSLTPQLSSFFHPKVKVPVIEGKQRKLVAPDKVAKKGLNLIHFVIQFQEGTEVRIGAKERKLISPRENRFIATFDSLNSRLHMDPQLESYCNENLDEVDGLLISGFHLIPSSTVGGESYQSLLDRKMKNIARWKSIRPDLYVHVEMGDFEKDDIMRYLIRNLKVDSIGMNEDEIAILENLRPGWSGLLNVVCKVKYHLKVKRVCVHSREYILSVMTDLLPPEKEVQALTYGADIAASLVATGKIVKDPNTDGMEMSKVGAKAVEELVEKLSATKFGRGAYATIEDETICLVPSMICHDPQTTVGIGDAMTAAAYYRQMDAIIERKKWR